MASLHSHHPLERPVRGESAEAGEQCEFLATGHHVDRVDLDDAHRVEGAAQMTLVDPSGGARPIESLGGERETAGLGCRDCLGAGVQEMNRPLMSTSRLVAVELYTQMVPIVSVGTTAALARVSPAATLSVEVAARSGAHGPTER